MITVIVLLLTLFSPDLSQIEQYAATQHIDLDTHEKVFYKDVEDCEKWKTAELPSLLEQSEHGQKFSFQLACVEVPWNDKHGSI